MLEVLCGPIASGKTTFCDLRASEGAIIVNDDSLVKAWHNGRYELYDTAKEGFYKKVESDAVWAGLLMGFDVVIDRPCHLRATRQRYLEIARTLRVPATLVQFDDAGAEVHAARRHRSDPRGHDLAYWQEVARRHEKLRQPVLANEGFDNIVPAAEAIRMIQAGAWATSPH